MGVMALFQLHFFFFLQNACFQVKMVPGQRHPCRINIFLVFFVFLLEKTGLYITYESSAKQMIHMKCQDLFSLKNQNVFCCHCDWRFGFLFFL